MKKGTLDGLRVVEMAGIGPGPFCGMLLADMGADVLQVERLVASDIGIPTPAKFNLLNRNKRSIAVDLKAPEGCAVVRRLIRHSHVLVEGFRPGVMERLGLGPEVCLEDNPSLVYGRMTGWGQTGPLSHCAAHDINYVALSGALSAIGAAQGGPVVPLNLVGDFGGGALFLAMGILAAIFAARNNGVGQVVDAAITDGVANLMTMHYGLRQAGQWSLDRHANVIDGGAPYYDTYMTKDGRYISIGALEDKFYRVLLKGLGLSGSGLPAQADRGAWAELRKRIATTILTKTRDEWCAELQGTDACFAPVLDMDECVNHPHHVAREAFVRVEGVLHPAPAPRFSVTPSEIRNAPPTIGEYTVAALSDWGFSPAEIAQLKQVGVLI